MAVQHYDARSSRHFWAFLPVGMALKLKRLMCEILGVVLIVFGLFLSFSLLSYSAADPSLNTAAAAPPANWMGAPGAVIADLLNQSFGMAAYALALPFLTWGASLLGRGAWSLSPRETKLRLLAWPIAVLSLAGFLSLIPAPEHWPLAASAGGLMGQILTHFISSGLGALGLPVTKPALAFAGLVIGLITLILCLGLRRKDLGSTYDALSQLAFGVREAASRTVQVITRLTGEGADGPLEGRQPTLWQRLFANSSRSRSGAIQRAHMSDENRTEPRLTRLRRAEDADDPYDDAQSSARAKIIRTQKKLRQSKRERAEAQPALELEPLDDYELPPLNLLSKSKRRINTDVSDESLEQNARLLEGVLQDFGVKGEIIRVRPGPVVTLYELEPAAGIKSSRVIGLADDIARSMSAISARVAVVPGRNVIGIELPNSVRETVFLRELLSSPEYENTTSKLSLALGKNIGGEPVISDLATMPHLLIAGTTGSGKSVGVNSMILSLLYHLSPAQCKFIMIDPKMLELSVYEGIPHLLAPVVTDPKLAVVALKWVVREMEDRYRKMSKLGVRNIGGYNTRVIEALESGETLTRTVQTGYDDETGRPVYEEEELPLDHIPFIVVVVDEMADLMMVAGKEIEGAVQRLAQMARAAGIHLITATQRPSVDVITGTIKANFPTRISFQVTSKIDSRTILGEQGGEQLLGQGDMLYMAGGGRIRRIHGPFVSDEEVEKIVRYLKKQGEPHYIEEVTLEPEGNEAWANIGGMSGGDELYDQALQIVTRDGKASTSYIQRRLQIGYNRAARIVERMEDEGVISPPNHAGKREILLGDYAR